MVTISGQHEPIAAPAAERPAIDAIERFLAGHSERPVCLFDAGGQPIPLPDSARRVLAAAVHELARDHAVAIVPVYRELTTQQAADLLNVSRQYLIRLLEQGDLPFTRTGTHRRIRLDDLLRYKEERGARRREGLRRLTRLSEELGLYDEEPARDESRQGGA